MKSQLQIEWLDYWFAPKIGRVNFGDYVTRIKKLTADGQVITAVNVISGGYEIEYGCKTARLG